MGHGGAERLRGEPAQRAKGRVVPTLLAPDSAGHLLSAELAAIQVLFAAVSRVGDQEPTHAPVSVQGIQPRLQDHLAPEVGIGAVRLLVPVGVVDLFLPLGECLGAAQD
jgi:hypothetical protein